MRWLKSEQILKGAYLGLLLYIALYQAKQNPIDWQPLLVLGVATLGGLVLALLIAAVVKIRQGYRVRGRMAAFLLFLLLESATLVYAGIILGTLVGIYLIRGLNYDPMFAPLVGGGALLGVFFGILPQVRKRLARIGLCLLLGTILMMGVACWLGFLGKLPFEMNLSLSFSEAQQKVLSGFFLLGIPVFYLLTFAGREEESEVEIAAMCALLGLALTPFLTDTQFRTMPFLLPVLLYFWYSIRVLHKLRVFKHVLRGISHARGGRYRMALLAFRRALELDPQNELARKEFWQVHVSLDLDLLSKDPQLLELVDFNLCVERAGTLLMQKPTPDKMEESHRLLDLVLSQKPEVRPRAVYWWAVGHCHNKEYDKAVSLLNELLDTEMNDPKDAHRNAVLMQAWQLSLTTLDILREQVGLPQLSQPGRRMEAIRAVERHLENKPDDTGVIPLKQILYQDLTFEEFQAACPEGRVPTAFDYEYSQHLGRKLVQSPEKWQQGIGYMQMSVRGRPELSPSLFSEMAEVYQRQGMEEEAWQCYQHAREFGEQFGHTNLSEEEQQVYFHVVKLLGERAVQREKLQEALECFQLLNEWNRSGLETLRTMATIYEKLGDPLAALRVNDRALVFNSKDPDLLERKDRYYYSVMPDQLRENKESVGKEIDVDYCVRKSRTLMEAAQNDPDLLDWVEHLLSLALVIQPGSRACQVLLARVHWRRGAMDQAREILEKVRDPKPEKFASHEDEDAWYQSCQLLGDLYLNNFDRADLAVTCFSDFRSSPKSGAKTLFRLGQAYEQLGDTTRAIRCYDQVTAYDGNPLSYEAQEAIDRLKGEAAG